MNILVFLILASLGLALAALLGFIWAVKTGQFEDTCTPSIRVLMDDLVPRRSGTPSATSDRSRRREEAEIDQKSFSPPPHVGGYNNI
jgi:cbb3-type cytochrome oxidase maturation protein